MNRKLATLSLAALVSCFSALGETQQRGDEKLSALRALKIEATTITTVERDPTATRTIVKLVLNPAKGSNINVEVWLPDAEKWNARFLGLGNGGAAGKINPAGLASMSAAGYAVATTDMGTAPNSDSGIGNEEVWKDFGYRATHLMTVVGKQIVKAHYGKDPELSYFSGGSTGGQQALQEAQRYPADYDGISAAVPAHCRTPLHAYFLWNEQILKKCAFTKSQDANVIAAANEYMASREILLAAGKFVSDPRCTAQDIEAVIALARKKDAKLTDEHAVALKKLFDGPRHAVTGERIFNGIPLGSSIEASHGHLYLFHWVFGKDKKLEDINFASDIDTYTTKLAPLLNAENPDLSAFEKRGGKLIMTLGTADSVVPYHASIDYYERVIERLGGLVEKAQSFFRFYVVPGLAHGGGPGINQAPNLLDAVRAWRETGVAPVGLTGRHVENGKSLWEMPILARFKNRVRELWDARQSKTNKQMRDQWNQWLKGWIGYYRLGERKPVAYLESWIRRRIRCYYWQRWHNAKGRYAKLRKLGVKAEQAKAGRSSKGAWRMAKHPAMHTALSNAAIRKARILMPSELRAR